MFARWNRIGQLLGADVSQSLGFPERIARFEREVKVLDATPCRFASRVFSAQ